MRPWATLGMVLGIMALAAGCTPREKPAGEIQRAAGRSIHLVDIPSGVFVMGTRAEGGFQQGSPAHSVAVKRFRIGATEVTFDQYDAYALATGQPLPQDEGWGRGARPVINLNLEEVEGFVAWLNAGTGRRFRLPTEAEWEYAARAGTTADYFWGQTPDPDYANAAGQAGRDVFATTAPVASFKPNGFGLYDTSGNVWERVEDCYHPTYVAAPLDGSAWLEPSCPFGVARGGYYESIQRGIRVTARAGAGATFRSMALGFRLAEDAPAS